MLTACHFKYMPCTSVFSPNSLCAIAGLFRKRRSLLGPCVWGQPRSTGWGGINVPVVAPQSVVMEAHGLLPCFHSVSGSQCPKFPLLHTEVPLGFLAY